MAWLRTARPEVSNGQAADLLRRTAIDIGPPGLGPGQRLRPHQPAGRADRRRSRASTRSSPTTRSRRSTAPSSRAPTTRSGAAGERRRISASVDSVEDPIDVYRVRIPARTRWKVLVQPRDGTGDPDLEIYDGAATHALAGPLQRRAQRPRRRPDGLRRRSRTAAASRGRMYVVVYVPEEARFADAALPHAAVAPARSADATPRILTVMASPAVPESIPQRLAAIRDQLKLLSDYL